MEDRCWGCGATGDHPLYGGHYWPCGTMKCSSIRGEACYETELAALQAQVEEMKPAGDMVCVKSNDIKTVLKWLDELALSQAPQEPVPELVDAVNRIEAALGKE